MSTSKKSVNNPSSDSLVNTSQPAGELNNQRNLVPSVDQSHLEIARYSTQEVIDQIKAIQSLMKEAMKEGEHFGKIPGCGDKLVLLKPGAEKLAFMFRLAPTYQIKIRDYDNGHREYEIITTLTHIPSGQVIGQGVGICSTLESKFRFRYIDSPYKPSQSEAEKLKAAGKGRWRKNGSSWIWQDKIESDNLADNFNTVLKMAKKRSLVDAILTATAASDIFTQDLEDLIIDEDDQITDGKAGDSSAALNKVNLNAKANQKTLDRNYTEEISKINSIEELNKYYKNLNEKEKKNLMPLLKNRKEEILSENPPDPSYY